MDHELLTGHDGRRRLNDRVVEHPVNNARVGSVKRVCNRPAGSRHNRVREEGVCPSAKLHVELGRRQSNDGLANGGLCATGQVQER